MQVGLSIFCVLLQWCGHCKNLKDTWIKLATATKGKAKVGAVDCTQHGALCSKHDIGGYPTLKKFGADKTKSGAVEYEGDRSLEDLVAFITGQKAAVKADEPKEDEFYVGTGEPINLHRPESGIWGLFPSHFQAPDARQVEVLPLAMPVT
jgi:hypothetical protein